MQTNPVKTGPGKEVITTKRITDPRFALLLFWTCWAAYFTTYIGRLNYSASMAEIITAEGISMAQAGMVGTCFFFSYGAGQLVNGILCDKTSPKWMLAAGLLGSSIVNLLMCFAPSAAAMAVFWCVNGYFQSMTWSPILRLFAFLLPDRAKAKASVNIQTTVAAGTLAAYGLSALFIRLVSWKAVFLFSAVLLAVVSIASLILISHVERHVARDGEEQDVIRHREGGNAPSQQSLFKILAASGIFFFLFSVIANGALKDGVLTWVPTFITDTFHVGTVVSILVTTVLPVTNLAGLYLGDFVNRKLCRDEIRTSTLFFVITAACLGLLAIPGLAEGSLLFSIFILAVTSSSMLAINTMLISILPLYFWKTGKVSTISGILNSSVYLGSACSTYGIGVIAQSFGWNITILCWCAMALVGAAACLLGQRFWKQFKTESK